MTHVSLGKQHKDEFHHAYSMHEIAYKVLVRKHKSKSCLGGPTHRFEDNIKLNLKQGWIVWTDTCLLCSLCFG